MSILNEPGMPGFDFAKMPSDAFGLSLLKPNFTLEPQYDKAFALGYPYGALLVDEDCDVAAAMTRLSLSDRTSWPTELGRALMWKQLSRALPNEEKAEGGKTAETIAVTFAKLVRMEGYLEGGWQVIALVEAFCGAAVTVQVLTDGLESLSRKRMFEHEPGRAPFVNYLNFLLLRVPTETAADVRSRLEAVFLKHTQGKLEPIKAGTSSSLLIRRLDILLHGRMGLERSESRYNGREYSYADLRLVTDDPAFVLSEAKKCFDYPDARLVYIAGPELLAHYLAHFRKFGRENYPTIIEELGPIRSDYTVELLTKMKREPRAKVWLAKHQAAAL